MNRSEPATRVVIRCENHCSKNDLLNERLVGVARVMQPAKIGQ